MPIDAETHRSIAVESARTGRDMYELVAAAWRAFQEGSQERGNLEQEVTCGHCGSTGYAVNEGDKKVLVPKFTPSAENPQQITENQVIIEARRLLLEALLGVLEELQQAETHGSTESADAGADQARDIERRMGQLHEDVGAVRAYLRGSAGDRKRASRAAKKDSTKA